MALGPHFSANKLQSVLKGALGGGSDTVRGALLHIGAQKTLQTGASVKDAKTLIQKLRSSGAIKDESHAKAVFRSAERVANAADRMRIKETKESRLAEYDTTRNQLSSLAANVVAQHSHGISVSGDANRTSHATSISEVLKAGAREQNKTSAPPMRPLLDIPFD
ncbi:MAG: hypothetical protein QG607_171 [Patescibacteria group bacterium]|jgi:hypothetical protein|nr:hypothetical protein [Patescibacteria group bacterium]